MEIHIQERLILKRKFTYIFLMSLVIAFTACNRKIEKIEEKPIVQESVQKELSLSIVTTNKLLYNMVKDIAADRHSIDYMFTAKDKLWNFMYTDDSISNISRKNLFFYWGSGIEPWTDGFIDKLTKNTVGPVSISRGIKFIELGREVKYKETILKDNPYFWMNIDDYKVAMLNVKNAIQDKDSKDRDFYEKRFSEAMKVVEQYQKDIEESSKKLKDYTFVVDGDELDYFTRYYNFKTLKLYNYGLILTQKDIEENLKVEQKIAEGKNVVFLYDDEAKLKSNEALINKYKLKTANIIVYKDDIKYSDILANNLNSLESLGRVQ
jgi:ABC-type Zn uptake system ZnuABC Zn-binding protein ZnuA